ncbi:hypothetical protein G9A89_022549 [Geosiphon pyriformis]|nr:hypothetical protein G9A89_022549 [Geosiphon pyriformis]
MRRLVNKLVFSALTISITISTTTASQIVAKAKNFKKQQQAVTTAMVTPNPFVVSDKIFSKISTAAVSSLSDLDGNSSNISPKIGQDQLLAVLPDVVLSGKSSPIPVAKQFINSNDFKDWGDQIKMESTVSFPISGAADGGAWENLVLVKKDSIRILPIANQKEIISLRDAFKVKLVNLLFGCIAFKINDLVSQKSPLLPSKLSSNTFGGPKIFKSLFAGSKSYAKAAAFVVLLGAAAVDMDLNLNGLPKTTTPMVSAVPSVPNFAVESRLASLESYLSKLSVLIKSLAEPVGALVVLVIKLLSTLTAMDVSVKECIDGLAKQNKDLAAVTIVMQKKITCLEKKCKQAGLEDGSDVDNKDFSISGMIKNSHKLVSIMSKMYELDMFESVGSKDSTTKNFKKQQQAVTTAMVTPNFFVVPDEILSKISTVAASPLSNIDSNSSSISSKMGQD